MSGAHEHEWQLAWEDNEGSLVVHEFQCVACSDVRITA